MNLSLSQCFVSPADADAVAALVAKGALNGVHFKTDDLDAAFIDQPPTS